MTVLGDSCIVGVNKSTWVVVCVRGMAENNMVFAFASIEQPLLIVGLWNV